MAKIPTPVMPHPVIISIGYLIVKRKGPRSTITSNTAIKPEIIAIATSFWNRIGICSPSTAKKCIDQILAPRARYASKLCLPIRRSYAFCSDPNL